MDTKFEAMDVKFEAVDAKLAGLKLFIAFNTALLLAIIGKLFLG